MDKGNLKKAWIKSEEKQKEFIGWNFTYLANKCIQEELPWSYQKIVKHYLKPEMNLLDMGTGGGELLSTFEHPYHKTTVTEGWDKNYQLLLKKLKPKGVNVQFVAENDDLNFPDNHFDIIINSHASFSVTEVARVLKTSGWFISQQVGDLNGMQLASKLIPQLPKKQLNFHLASVLSKLKLNHFTILYENEHYPAQNFFDMDGFIYYIRTISWEFPNFSVENNFAELVSIYEELQKNGFIYNQQHRFIFVAQSKK